MRHLRVTITSVVFLLICIGIVMIYSSSGVYALQDLGSKTYFLSRHLIFLIIGLSLSFAVMWIDYRDLRPLAKPHLLIGLLMLIVVLSPLIGKTGGGARRWFRLGPLSFQPSEYMKLVFLIYTADFLARKQKDIRHFFKGFLPLILVLGAVCLLIVKQPDLGSVLLLSSIVLFLMFLAGARILHIGLLGLLSLPAVYFLVATVPYRRARIMSFLNPWEDPLGVGFQLSQSQIALGSGGLFGVGLGKSVQKLFYLPAAHTDFIFSIIGEETGLIGTTLVIWLFIVFIWQGARIAKRITDPFGYYLSMGIVILIGLQALINIGVSIGALPTKGLPLPFISYGGSALIFNMMSVALLLNISRIEDLSGY